MSERVRELAESIDPIAWRQQHADDDAWSIESCRAYAKQLRDKTRANRAEHAAEAIEYLLSKRWVGLTDEEIKEIWLAGIDHGDDWLDVQGIARAIENALRSKNT